MVETVVEGEVQRPLGETEATGVVFAMTASFVVEKAHVATAQLGLHPPPPPVCRYQAVAKRPVPEELSLAFRDVCGVPPLTFQKRNS
jgi:hypothetical protein